MKLYVIMGNDFPSGVMSGKEEATDWCNARMDEQRIENNNRSLANRRPPIYWRSYEFEFDRELKSNV